MTTAEFDRSTHTSFAALRTQLTSTSTTRLPVVSVLGLIAAVIALMGHVVVGAIIAAATISLVRGHQVRAPWLTRLVLLLSSVLLVELGQVLDWFNASTIHWMPLLTAASLAVAWATLTGALRRWQLLPLGILGVVGLLPVLGVHPTLQATTVVIALVVAGVGAAERVA